MAGGGGARDFSSGYSLSGTNNHNIIGVRKPIYEGKQTLSCRRVRNVPNSTSTGAFAVWIFAAEGSHVLICYDRMRSLSAISISERTRTLPLQGLTVSTLYQNKSTRECAPLYISNPNGERASNKYGKCAHYGHENICFPSQIGFLAPIML